MVVKRCLTEEAEAAMTGSCYLLTLPVSSHCLEKREERKKMRGRIRRR
jgi:hypothetical protein